MAMVNSGEGTTVMEAAKAFRPRILAERERIEAGRRLPEDLARELARAGFFRIFLPAAYGDLALRDLPDRACLPGCACHHAAYRGPSPHPGDRRSRVVRIGTGHTDTHAVILATAIGSCSARLRASSRELCPTAFGRG